MRINVSGAQAGLIKKHTRSKTNAKDKWGNSREIKDCLQKVNKTKTNPWGSDRNSQRTITRKKQELLIKTSLWSILPANMLIPLPDLLKDQSVWFWEEQAWARKPVLCRSTAYAAKDFHPNTPQTPGSLRAAEAGWGKALPGQQREEIFIR